MAVVSSRCYKGEIEAIMSSESGSTGRRSLRRSIRRLTESLGSSPGAVAASLVALQVHGCPRNSAECAIARYLRAVVGTDASVADLSVSDRRVHVARTDRHLPMTVRLPTPITRFIRAFDDGGYPDLIDSTRTEGCSPTVSSKA
jgi:hypothetical protein